MKSLIAPMLTTASFLTIFICGLSASAEFAKPYAPHRFDHLADGMWSVEPKRVDPGEQNYERVAALIPVREASQDLAMPAVVGTPSAGNPTPLTDVAVTRSVDSDPCEQKYKSYRAADNSYQPFDGGPRRQCELAPPPASVATSQPAITPVAVADSTSEEHGSLCATKYSSYNAADDTYQPFGGGSRKPCLPSLSVASN
jgi:BA14K-like protein